MFKSFSRRTLAVTLVALAAVTFAAVAYANHSWNGYHWARTSNPFTLKLGDNLTSADWKSHLRQTSSDWNAGRTPVQTTIVAGQSSSRKCSMVAGTTQVCNGTYGFNGWLGLASINVSGSHITQGTAKMNDSYFNSSTYNNTNEREHVMCQEVAHTFGLGHQDESGKSLNTCMDYFSNTGANAGSTISTKPNQHDFDELNTIYAHLDSTTTIAAASASSQANEVTNEPYSWGMLVSQSASGRSSVYEREHTDGTKTLTHVYWAAETAERCPGCDHRYDQ
jgi:hypothetical protein